jgi:hypothetical protein
LERLSSVMPALVAASLRRSNHDEGMTGAT